LAVPALTFRIIDDSSEDDSSDQFGETQAALRTRYRPPAAVGSGGTAASSSVKPPLLVAPPLCGPGVSNLTVLPAGYRFVIATGSAGLPMASIVIDLRAPSSSLPAGYTIHCITTSDGERISQLVQAAMPVIDVYPGGSCGVYNSQGALLQCVVGSSCLAPSASAAGVCQPFVQAPNNQG
jgi:hypothetical protein